jgi:hypothetical protein
MKERPILMCGEMVCATLADLKTQTRRIVKPRIVPIVDECFRVNGKWCNHTFDYDLVELSPYGKPADRLWVRETYIRGGNGKPLHCADADKNILGLAWENGFRKTPSIFMRRWESRLTLEVTAVRVERLNDISEEDAKGEGTTPSIIGGELEAMRYRAGYQTLWESINGAGSWALNPWVWVITFKRVTS